MDGGGTEVGGWVIKPLFVVLWPAAEAFDFIFNCYIALRRKYFFVIFFFEESILFNTELC